VAETIEIETSATSAAPAALADVTTEKTAPEAEAEKVELPKGAKAPLKSGGAPKGYEVKGNADSGLYHEPDGQWYDATIAEFYFKTAEDAEAAGFTRAGGGSANDAAAEAEEDDK
jgi:large subunit ribosomal protein L4